MVELPEPRVLVSISTEAQNDGAINRTAIEALADEPGSLICTTSAESPDQFQAPSSKVLIAKFLPHAQMMPHLDCVVSHDALEKEAERVHQGLVRLRAAQSLRDHHDLDALERLHRRDDPLRRRPNARDVSH